jgi:tetratricopeptide (TPR) repeat protein
MKQIALTANVKALFALAVLAIVLAFVSCGPTTETTKTETTPPPLATKDGLFQRGQQLYLQQNLDSALVFLNQALAMDANYKDALEILAPLHYDLAMRSESAKKKNEQLRKSRDYYAKVEAFGVKESETYERICEIANMLNDDKTYLKYAKKNAEAYPYDRQYYNLSVGYANVEDWNNLISLAKKAIDKFKDSQYIGSFYRQLGRAYTKIDRDQTAEKTFYVGLGAIDSRLSELRKANPEFKSTPEYARLKDDKIGMLISLKNLHTTYKAGDKLADVEKKLKELGR